MWIVAWLTATPVRVVRAALNRVGEGDLDAKVVVFDGTELGELQRGFNSMVDGLRERERVRDLFGKARGTRGRGRRRTATAPARRRGAPRRGVVHRHRGIHRLVTSRPPAEVVDLLNRFFAVIVEEVDTTKGLVNKFEGDAALAIFGAPVALDCPRSWPWAPPARSPAGCATRSPSVRPGSGWLPARWWPETLAPRNVSSTR